MVSKTNYCGPDSSPKWVKSFLSSDLIPGGKLNDACEQHDKDYDAYNEAQKKA